MKRSPNKSIGKPPIGRERQLKRKLSSSYWKDSNDFLWRLGIIKENLPYESSGFLAKMYVDLLMCAECALKSLIISLSSDEETPEKAYLKARGFSHNLEKLYNEVEHRAKGRVKLLTRKHKCILLKANSLGVGYRYDITTFLFLTQEDFIEREFNEGQVSSIINYEFITTFNKMLFSLKKIAKTSNDRYFSGERLKSGDSLKDMRDRQDAFFKKMKNLL